MSTKKTIGERLAGYRAAGWVVAVHNDYRECKTPCTFWLLTKPDPTSTRRGRYVSGEGESDAAAFDYIDSVLLDLEAIEKRDAHGPDPDFRSRENL